MKQQEFLERLNRFYQGNVETSRRKNSDYAGSGDAFANFRSIEHLTHGKVSVEMGILTRMSDKMQRVANLLESDPQVKSESVYDTLQDLANYAGILAIYLESKRSNGQTAVELGPELLRKALANAEPYPRAMSKDGKFVDHFKP